MTNSRFKIEPFFGFFDSDISELVEQFPWFVEKYDCVITCLDSGRRTYETLVRLSPAPLEHVGPYAVLPGEVLVELRQTIFSGFDEFYVFKRNLWRETHPDLWKDQFTSDRIFLKHDIPATLLGAFVRSGACRYASDGTGLNVIVTDPEEFQGLSRLRPLE